MCDFFALYAEVKDRIVLHFVGTFYQDKAGKSKIRQMPPTSHKGLPGKSSIIS